MKWIGCVIVSLAVSLFGNGQTEANPPPYYAGCSEWVLGTDGYWYRACAATRSYHLYGYGGYGTASYSYPTTISLSSAATETTQFNREMFAAYVAKSEKYEALLKASIASGVISPELKALAKPIPPGAQLERNDCQRCHSAEDGATKGGKHVFFKGGLWAGTPEDEEKALELVESGKMPKDRSWSDKEKFQWLSFAARRPADGRVEAAKKPEPEPLKK